MMPSLFKNCSWKDKKGRTLLIVKAKPNAKRTMVVGLVDINTSYPVKKALEISINEKPDNNKANLALIELLSNELNIPKNKISLEHGSTGRIKVVCIYI